MDTKPLLSEVEVAARRRRAEKWLYWSLAGFVVSLWLAERDPFVLGPGPMGVSVGIGWRQVAVAWGSPRLSLLWWMHGNPCDWGEPAAIDCVYHWRAVAVSLFWAVEICAVVATISALALLRLRVVSSRASRVWRGVCAGCGYDLRGLQPDAVCPECGRRQPEQGPVEGPRPK